MNRPYSIATWIEMKLFLILLLLGSLLVPDLSVRGAEPPGLSGPAFQELFELVKGHLTTAAQTNLNEVAVRGLLSELKDRVEWVGTPGSESDPNTVTLIDAPAIFDSAFIYLRIHSVEKGLAQAIAAARNPLLASNKITGIIFDLRFANGMSYEAAADTADAFLGTSSPLLDVDGNKLRSTTKSNALHVPVVALVNQETSGSAEALAAIIRQERLGLIIGAPTRGRAFLFNQFILTNGQAVKIATASVKTGDGTELGGKGVQPDLRVTLDPAAEQRFFDNPFVEVDLFSGKPLMASPAGAPSAGLAATNLPALSVIRRRMTESDLVRQRRSNPGSAIEFDTTLGSAENGRVVHDPALARALDFLKGVGRAQLSR